MKSKHKAKFPWLIMPMIVSKPFMVNVKNAIHTNSNFKLRVL